MKQQTAAPSWSLAGAVIVISPKASATERYAGAELARYLHQLTGRISRRVTALPAKGTLVVLDAKVAAALGARPDRRQLGEQGYRLAAVPQGARRSVVIAACAPAGTLYGVYGLLEELGMGFYAGGDTFPELPAPATIPADFDRTGTPAFKVRGNMLHYNFLCGPTNWGLADYKFYFDQLARMRANMLLMHWYDGEPGAAYECDGEYLAGGGTPNSLTKPWGALAALRTSEFSFETGRCFDEEIFSSPMGEDQPDLLTEIKRSEVVFREATQYARTLAVNVAAGFEAPRGDPTVPAEQHRFKARVRQFLARNPQITHLALWEHESGGCVGSEPPVAGSPAAKLLEKQRHLFQHVGNDQRVWEAIRFGRFAQFALEVLDEVAPTLPLVLVGWGGDRWMQFADYCLGYDRLFPAKVIFTCHDNIDASMGPNVSTPWGQLPPARERWAMPWVEGDIEACDVRQPHVESLGLLAPDALRKGCQGLMTLQWRTRDVEEETGFIARYAWDTALTPARFYRDLARHAFGPDQEERMGTHLETLQRLGARWTGVRGTAECSRMRWTGFVPHYPFELDASVPAYLAPLAEKAVQALAEVPVTRDAEAAFHLIQDKKSEAKATYDYRRCGVKELRAAAAALKKLADQRMKGAPLRPALRAIEEQVYAIRPQLVANGMSGRAYQAVDTFLIAIHHLWRNAGAGEHRRVLCDIRKDLQALRQAYVKTRRLARLERLDYLEATLTFALDFDAAVMLMADNEAVDQALAASEAAKVRGDAVGAAKIAARAYGALTQAGMQSALRAFTHKLSSRCDFGTLCTVNVKPVPLYWQTLARLESYQPAVPPRELHARGKMTEVWLSWVPGPGGTGQNLYRRTVGRRSSWTRVNRQPLGAGCQMFCDRPGKPGAYEYAVTALAAAGWESAYSHLGHAVCGPQASGPRIIASKPYACLQAGEALALRAVVISDRDVADVTLCWRQAGAAAWHRVPMMHRFRDSYAVSVPAATFATGTPTLEFYVEAADGDRNLTTWPLSAPLLPWSASRLA